ncbi:hypothetical protein [Microvirga tunisiensis]|uniref:Uncharacterized protein n=1 Tax=Microvirga tunisiensis TaxID=2108360 RepID=A0A5N7MFJ7_9HYPH|nr:hypothetical protein [Microvirga tunisiensis]MPR07514.1 hypothetical protein [Microvirga tunisiensis]MPR25781.1 hypothetical protein [Microvirga tunisiensis]
MRQISMVMVGLLSRTVNEDVLLKERQTVNGWHSGMGQGEEKLPCMEQRCCDIPLISKKVLLPRTVGHGFSFSEGAA